MSEAFFAFLLAALASALVTSALLRWFPSLAEDVANHRSLHVGVIPRIGGVGVALAALAGIAWIGTGGGRWPLALAAIAGLSFCDDRYGLPAWLRLGAHVGVVALLLAGSGDLDWPWALALGFAWVWCINLFNFMDGADGLAGGMAAVGFAALGAAALLAGAPDLAVLAFVIAGAAVGFLLFNLPPARVFLGDAGSISFGFLFGLLAWAGGLRGLWPWWFPPFVILPFVIDATMTLLGRLLAGQAFWQAHREHAYQKLVRMGWSRGRLLRAAYPLMLLNALAALLVLNNSGSRMEWLLVSLAATQAALRLEVERRWRSWREQSVNKNE